MRETEIATLVILGCILWTFLHWIFSNEEAVLSKTAQVRSIIRKGAEEVELLSENIFAIM